MSIQAFVLTILQTKREFDSVRIYIFRCVSEKLSFWYRCIYVCMKECNTRFVWFVDVCACTCINMSVVERKCVCCTWLFVCLGSLISLKWPLSIFIRRRKSDWQRGSRSEKDGKKQCLALIDRGSYKRGVKWREGSDMRWIERRALRPRAAVGIKAQQPAGPEFKACVG